MSTTKSDLANYRIFELARPLYKGALSGEKVGEHVAEVIYSGTSYLDALERFLDHHRTKDIEEIVDTVLWVSYEGSVINARFSVVVGRMKHDISRRIARSHASGMAAFAVRSSLCGIVSNALLEVLRSELIRIRE